MNNSSSRAAGGGLIIHNPHRAQFLSTYMYCLTPSLSHVFQELLSVYLFVLGNIEFVSTMLGLCCSLEVARTSGLQSPISC